MEKKYAVYMHVFPNGKRYIGMTGQGVQLRWKKNGSGYKSQRLMYRAIKKYGWKNISHIIVASNLSLEQAAVLEQQLIEKYNSTDARHGYNMSVGGERGPLGVKRSPETIAKLRASHIGKKSAHKRVLSEAEKEHLRKINLGKTIPLEVRKKISEKNKNQKPTEYAIRRVKEVCSKPVRRISDGAVFESATIAQKETGEHRNTITRHCRGETVTARWEFVMKS